MEDNGVKSEVFIWRGGPRPLMLYKQGPCQLVGYILLPFPGLMLSKD